MKTEINEDESQELQATEIAETERLARENEVVDSKRVLALLRHIEWQADQHERVRVRLDHYLDAAHGSPATAVRSVRSC